MKRIDAGLFIECQFSVCLSFVFSKNDSFAYSFCFFRRLYFVAARKVQTLLVHTKYEKENESHLIVDLLCVIKDRRQDF